MTEEENNETQKPLESCFPRLDLNSGVGESSRGCGRASLLDFLETRRTAQLDIPAACASQGAMEFFRNEHFPQQVASPNSSSSLPQSFVGTTEAATSAKVGDDANAKNEKNLVHEDGPLATARAERSRQPALSTEVPKPEMPCEDPYGLPTEIKKEEESPEEDPESLTRGQPSGHSVKQKEYVPYAPERSSMACVGVMP